MDSTYDSDYCYRHLDRLAREKCPRCGRPICTMCAVRTNLGVMCPHCVQELAPPEQLQKGETAGAGVSSNDRFLNPFRVPMATPIVTQVLVGIIVFIYVIELYLNFQGIDLKALGAMNGERIIEHGEVWRFFTAMWLHFGLMHLGFNGFALWSLGRDVESLFGSTRFLIIYLLSGLFGSLLSFAAGPFRYSFAAGASGAVFGVVGMTIAFYYFHRSRLGDWGKRRQRGMIQLVAINLIFGFSVGGIDNAAHIGGMIAGFAIGFLLVPRYLRPQLGESDRKLVDLASLARRWWVPLGAGLLLAWGTYMALGLYS